MDLDFGVRTWYKRPTFFLKIASATMSFIIFIYLCVACNMFFDPAYPVVNGKEAGNLVAATFFFFLVTVSIISALIFLRISQVFRWIIIVVSCVSAALAVAIPIIFGAKFGRKEIINTEYKKMVVYNLNHVNDPNDKVINYFTEKTKSASRTLPQTIYKGAESYYKNRTSGASSILLGFFITWCILVVILIFNLIQEQSVEHLGQGATESLSEKLNDDNKFT